SERAGSRAFGRRARPRARYGACDASGAEEGTEETMVAKTLAGKRVAILATDGVEHVELTSPKRALEAMGVTVHVIAPHGDRVRSWKHTEWGEHIEVDRTIDAASADDYDALVLPGGVMNPDRLRRDPRVLAFVRRFFDDNKIVAVICHGAWTLIDAGV